MTGFPLEDTQLADDGGQIRWEGNQTIGRRLDQLADYLVIGGMEELHVTHYRRLAYAISRWPESMEALRHEGRLKQIPSIGPTIQHMVQQLVDTGTCDKWAQWAQRVPESVLDLAAIPGLGVKTARSLFMNYGMDGLPALQRALDAHRLADLQGIGPKTVVRIRQHLEAKARGEV
ncbi:MAG: hypothetical protein HN559_16540 [Gemmatimonadetes bacterium]|nr:hypothetical protein [Gemmatimonadota bacterium]